MDLETCDCVNPQPATVVRVPAAPATPDLGALPEPNIRGPVGTGTYFDGYTANQMRAERERTYRLGLAAGQATQVAPVGLTDAEIASACLSYRHDFGLLPDDQRRALMAQAREWDRALQKERAHGIPAPRADDKGG